MKNYLIYYVFITLSIFHAFVIKFNSSGTRQWTKPLGTWQNDLANGVATDSSGNFYVTGVTYGGLDCNSNAGYFVLFWV